eukprot:3617950-Prymnesium_polylepis.1
MILWSNVKGDDAPATASADNSSDASHRLSRRSCSASTLSINVSLLSRSRIPAVAFHMLRRRFVRKGPKLACGS